MTVTAFRTTATSPKAWLLVAMFLVLVVTNAGFDRPPVDDALSYRAIAAAAPGVPAEPVGSAYTGRFAIHYLVGLFSHLTSFSLSTSYDIVWVVLVAALLAALHANLRTLPTPAYAMCAALFIFDPYALRSYLLETSMLQDLVFLIGLALCLLALRRPSVRLLLIGSTIAILGRQTAITLAPVAAAWVLLDPAWRGSIRRPVAWCAAGATCVLTFGIFAATKAFTAGFSKYYEPSILHDSVMNTLVQLPDSATSLAAHLARTDIPLLIPLTVIAALVWKAGWRTVPFAFWGSLVLALAIAAQPALIDPDWVGFHSNEQRLSALALLPLVCAAAEVLARFAPTALGWPRAALAVGLLAVASLHHEFSSFGPRSLLQFLTEEVVIAGCLAVLILTNTWTHLPVVSPSGPATDPSSTDNDALSRQDL